MGETATDQPQTSAEPDSSQFTIKGDGRLTRVIGGFTKLPWLIEPGKFEAIAEVVRSEHLRKGITDAKGEDIKENPKYSSLGDLVKGKAGGWYRKIGSLAVIPISGTIFPRGSLLASSGVCSSQEILSSVKAAEEDADVHAVLFDVDSPGGYVLGVPECAKVIYEARKNLKITAHVSESYSAAYYLATQCSEVVCTPSGGVGSVGVLAIHASHQRELENQGIDVTIVRIPAWKAEANPYEKLTEGARRHILGDITEAYEDFVAAVARGRGVSADEVKEKYGKGRTIGAETALGLGMVDRLEAWHETVERARADADERRNKQTRSAKMAEETKTPTTEAATSVDAVAGLQAQIDKLTGLVEVTSTANAELQKRAEQSEKALEVAVKTGSNLEAKIRKQDEAAAAIDAEAFVASLGNIPTNAETHGPLIARMRATLTAEDSEEIEGLLSVANVSAGKAELFTQQTAKTGRNTIAAGGGTANDKLWQAAAALVKEGKFKTQGQALAHVSNSDEYADLRRQSLAEMAGALVESGMGV